MWRTLLVLVVCWSSIASADLASEEKGFGAWGYKAMRDVHSRTCTCKPDGSCTLKVSRDELATQLRKFTEAVNAEIQKSWPVLGKKMSAMTDADARAYGADVAKRYIATLPRTEADAWNRMVNTCWAPPSDASRSPEPDAPHDGSLDASGKTDDLTDGKLDEASAIASFMKSCRASGGARVAPFCGCISDYLRQSPPSAIRVAVAATSSNDTTEFEKLPGVTTCNKWFADGARGRNPFAKKGMKLSTAVEASFNRCRTTPKGKPEDTGVTHCNRHVATH